MSSGFDFSSKMPYRLLKGRMGVYGKQIQGQVSNYRLGGNLQQERMIIDKRRSLERALWNSYQGADILRLDAEDRNPMRALINPNQLKQDYDDKIISVGFEYNLKCGDVFEWVGTNTYWLVYLQDLTELAYFRGDIRKCSYEISWKENDQVFSTFAAIRGPVETKLSSGLKHGVMMDFPNYSLSILMPKTEDTLKYFKRYAKFYLQGNETCWEVQAIDWLSTPGVLEVIALENYANETEDDVANGIVGGLITKPINPNTEEQESQIIGETFIKPKRTCEYRFNGSAALEWHVKQGTPVELVVSETDPRKVSLRWTTSYCGQFDLFYGEYKKTIVVESLF